MLSIVSPKSIRRVKRQLRGKGHDVAFKWQIQAQEGRSRNQKVELPDDRWTVSVLYHPRLSYPYQPRWQLCKVVQHQWYPHFSCRCKYRDPLELRPLLLARRNHFKRKLHDPLLRPRGQQNHVQGPLHLPRKGTNANMKDVIRLTRNHRDWQNMSYHILER